MKNLFWPSLAILAVLGVGIVASGYYKLYLRYEYFDAVMHLVGSTALAWLLSTLAVRQKAVLSYRSYAVFIVGAVLIFGVVWELLEYLSGEYMKGTLIYAYYRGGDLQDTLADLVADMTGATIYMLIYRLGMKKPKILDTLQRPNTQ